MYSIIANGNQTETKLPCTLEEFLVAQKLLPRSVVVEHTGEAVAVTQKGVLPKVRPENVPVDSKVV